MENNQFIRYGRVIAIDPLRQGTSSRGNWQSQSFVIEEINTQYPKKLYFSVFGEDRIKDFNIQAGALIKVRFDVDAHEYNGRWFNEVRAYDVRPWDGQTSSSEQAPTADVPTQAETQTNNVDPFGPANNTDPLPFG